MCRDSGVSCEDGKGGEKGEFADRELARNFVVGLPPVGRSVFGRLVFLGFIPLRDVRVADHTGPKNYSCVVTANELF